MKNKTKIIPLFTVESRIKRSLRRHLQKLGFTRTKEGLLQAPSDSKESIRRLHRAQRDDLLKKEREFIRDSWPKFDNFFANGADIIPNAISPKLELIEGGTWQSDLFRLSSLMWSVPVSKGYGRRMRFLVWDQSNGKLIGLIGLGDPVFNLRVRDEDIGWTTTQRKRLLVNVMDAFVLGAVPPYNLLMCGKLIACLIRTKEVRDVFSAKYERTRGIISNKKKHARLLAVTTSSALGRSSLYNRLSLNGTKYFRPLGYTAGWGHFHIPVSLFEEMREFLHRKKHKYANNNRYGEGPNWRLRAIRHTMSLLNINPSLLRHGINREVFICELATNTKRYLTEKSKQVHYSELLSLAQVSELSIARWVIPRSDRRPEYKIWNINNTLGLLKAEKSNKIEVMLPRKEIISGTC